MEELPVLMKVVLVGDSGVGKTNLMARYIKSEFLVESKTTIGVEFANRQVSVKGRNVKVQVWDTAGQERYRSIVSSYYRGAEGVMLVYDISRQSSFESIEKWFKEIRNYGDEGMAAMLVGNKSDLKHLRSIRTEDYARSHSMLFLQTSALDATNVEEAFQMLVEQMLERRAKNVVKQEVKTTQRIENRPADKSKQKKQKKCC